MSAVYRYYSRSATHALFEPILAALPPEVSSTNPSYQPQTSKDLAKFIEALQRFQHALLSTTHRRPEDPPQPFPRIPTKLFKNYAPGGPLHTILHVAYAFRAKKALRKWDLDNAAKLHLYRDMLAEVAITLREQGWIVEPVLAFASSVPLETRAELAPPATLMRATVVPRMMATVTHQIHTSPEQDGASGGEWYRTLDKQNGHVLLHYWYRPDSQDVWVPENSGEFLDPEPAPQHRGPWHVSTRWLRDSIVHNEWMNEEDYEVEDAEVVGPPSTDVASTLAATTPAMIDDESDAGSVDGNDGGNEDDNDNGQEEPDQEEEDEQEDEDENESKGDADRRPSLASPLDIEEEDDLVASGRAGGPAPFPQVLIVDLDWKGVRQQRYQFEPVPNPVLHNISHTVSARLPSGTATAPIFMSSQERWAFLENAAKSQTNDSKPSDELVAVPKGEHVDAMDIDHASPPVKPEPPHTSPASALRAVAPLPAALPVRASWFSMDTIHDTERITFPEFFQSQEHTHARRSKNHIRTAEAYLYIRDSLVTAYRTSPSQHLSLQEAMKYLKTAPLEEASRIHRFLDHWGIINFQVRESEPSGILTLHASRLRETLETPVQHPLSESLPVQDYVYASPRLLQHRKPPSSSDASLATAPAVLPSLSTDVPRCEVCTTKLIPTSPLYVLVRPPHIRLCHACFVTGRYPTDLCSVDFTYIGPAIAPIPSANLLDLVDPAEPWTPRDILSLLTAVQDTQRDHLGGVDWASIAAKFRRPPRTPLECAARFLAWSGDDEDSMDMGTTISTTGNALLAAENPVMHLVATIASIVNPGVAAATAKEALKRISDLVVASDREDGPNALIEGGVLLKELAENGAAPAARALAAIEDREIEILVRALVDTQLRKLAIKMADIKGAP
ncbi:hypothetical protein HKX48_003925 [Thoreauomyces humboldtii]|nr:hypothetical protein HKX48_003925 [Thoreauomyces humboldtii]